jgi:polyisoprenoid-binding protein YceI
MLRAVFGLLIALMIARPVAADSTGRREIDPAASHARFSVQHIYVDRVTGTIPILRGAVVLPENSVLPLSVSAELDPSRIKSADDDRDAALQGPDWFDVKRFPIWTFVSAKITATAKDEFAMDGLLTIHGVARSQRLDVTVGGTPAHPVYHATGTIDRHAFEMTVTRLDPVIGNPVDVTLDIALR